ncbi:MAG: VOC family protein [Pyrinomonadaceae bacterium]
MKLTGLDLLVLEVNSLAESLNFYCNTLGFELETQNLDSEPPTASLRAGSLKITLAQHLETMLRRGRGVHFFFGVDDVDQMYSQLLKDFPQLPAPTDEGWGGRFISLQDPDKYRFFFVTWSDSGKR